MTLSCSLLDVDTEKPSQCYQILVVDDEPLLCRMVSVMLKRAGFEICTAYNGFNALEAVNGRKPDLITLDVMMPGISGLEVARRLRANARTSAIPIVFVTAMDRSVSDELRALFKEAGIYHIDKPFSQHDLITQVSNALHAVHK
jgi:two-component system, sensor histidine kinase and response regulator